MKTPGQSQQHEAPAGLLGLLTIGAFWVFAQIFMIAPILPRLAEAFETQPEVVGLAVPAYLLPYGAMTLVWGPLSDRVGRRAVILGSLVAFTALTASTAFVDGAGSFIAMRAATAIGASGVVPIALALITDLFPFERRGRALGWLFAGMAGGIAAGAGGGALAETALGWNRLLLTVGAGGALLLLAAVPVLPRTARSAQPPPWRKVASGYLGLLRTARGKRTYAYVLVNSIFHAGVYTWLALYLSERFDITGVGIGLTLLGYGVPGFLFGPFIGRAADRFGRRWILPIGLAVGSLGAASFIPVTNLIVANVAVIVLSLGYDLTQPLLAGIVSDLPGRPGQAMGLNVFTLFTGMGLGSLLFQALLPAGFSTALAIFAGIAALAAVLAVALFREERPSA